MHKVNKSKKMLLVLFIIILAGGIVAVCIIGQINFNKQKYKNVTGAKQVLNTGVIDRDILCLDSKP